MMFKKKAMASAMTAALVAGAMLSSGAQAVRISENEVGQLLLGEMYLARTSDYSSTEIKVVNTSLTDAVKAKIVFRSKKHSDECKDLILYLTPGDVAYMTVRLGANGQPEVFTDDDSLLAQRMSNGSAVFASQLASSGQAVGTVLSGTTASPSSYVASMDGKVGVAYPMVAPRTEPAADSCAQGHIEVIAPYAVTGTVTNLASGLPNVTITRPMSKFDLLRVFDTSKTSLNVAANNVTNNDAIPANNGANYSSRVQLMGSVVIGNANDRLMSNMVALRDGANPRTGGVVTHVVTSPTYDESYIETFIGQNMGSTSRGSLVTDMAWDFDGALATPRLFNLLAVNGTNNETTYPTKYRQIVTGRYSGTGATYAPPFRPDGSMQVATTTFDNQENSAPGSTTTLCITSPCSTPTVGMNSHVHEVEFSAVGAGWSLNGSTSGWYNLAFTNFPGLDRLGYTWVGTEGAPAIGYSHFYKTGLTQSVVSRMGR